MSEKKINYLSRTFDDYKSELIKFSNKYYPELSDSYDDSSVGSWFIDLVAAVGDNLSYHIDRAYNETNINSANLKSTVLNIARTNGLKVPGPKASICEVEISCNLGVNNSNNTPSPDWEYAPIIKRSSLLSAGDLNFQLTEDVDFSTQFNSNGYSNRRYSPNRDSNGNITGYTVTKSTLAVNGSTRMFKKVIQSQDLKPFMEIVLPDRNVMNVESIIFKETCNFQANPDVSEFYVDSEMFRVGKEDAYTYRYFETDSLADQYRFGSDMSYIDGEILFGKGSPKLYSTEKFDYYSGVTDSGSTEESDSSVFRYSRGKWKSLRQKFITEYTDNGYMKIIFGSGVEYDSMPEKTNTLYAERAMSNLINNDMLGVLPREGWTMFVLYRVGGGIESNIGVGAIDTLALTVSEFNGRASNGTIRGNVLNSLRVTNTSTAVAGKDAPSTAELKYLVKYNNNAQERCVTLKDYEERVMMMPPKYGCPFRVSAIEENNKVVLSVLTVNRDGTLSKQIPNTLSENIVEYMSHYKQINDYLMVRSGKIYNMGLLIDVFINKTYDAPTVMSNIIKAVKEYMSISNHNMGEDIFLGDLQKEINTLDGVIATICIDVYNIVGENYSTDEYSGKRMEDDSVCSRPSDTVFRTNGTPAYRIDIADTDNVLLSDYNSMFEIKYDDDIQIRCKLV